MYRHFLLALKDRTEWFQFLDIDEFLYLGSHRRIADYVAGLPAAWDSIAFNWLVFGPNGHRERPPGSVLLNFTRRGGAVNPHTKTLTRASAIDPARLDAHHRLPLHHHWDQAWFGGVIERNIIGMDMDRYWLDFPRAASGLLANPAVAARMIAGPCIFHYMLQSEADFERRRARGMAADFSTQGDWSRMQREGRADDLLVHLGEVEDDRLARFWRGHLAQAWRLTVPETPTLPNAALGKSADQSSVSIFSHHPTTQADAAGAISGRPTGHYGFHTDEEDRPWWSVDLGAPHDVSEIRIFNRLEARETAARFRAFTVSVSDDAVTWQVIIETDETYECGGADGFPFVCEAETPVRCRHVRITLAGRGFLHLDEVEVYGEAVGGEAVGGAPVGGAPV
jgi:hypothetical protein